MLTFPRRLHLIEFHEQPWFPRFLRDLITDALSGIWRLEPVRQPERSLLSLLLLPIRLFFVLILAVTTRLGLFKSPAAAVAPILSRAVKDAGATRVVDLCSGGAGPVVALARHLQVPIQFTLTDLYPNLRAMESAHLSNPGRIKFEPNSVDAMKCHLRGFRTMFACFHHFRPEEGRRIIADAVANGEGIAIFELQSRSIPQILLAATVLPALFASMSLFAVEPSLASLFFSFVVPIVPLTGFVDGLTSHVRTYTKEEYLALVDQIPNSSNYTWQWGRTSVQPCVEYFIGVPKSGAAKN